MQLCRAWHAEQSGECTHAAGRVPDRELLYSCRVARKLKEEFEPHALGMLPAYHLSNGNCKIHFESLILHQLAWNPRLALNRVNARHLVVAECSWQKSFFSE